MAMSVMPCTNRGLGRTPEPVDEFPEKKGDARYFGHAFSALPFCVAYTRPSRIYVGLTARFTLGLRSVRRRSYVPVSLGSRPV